MNSVPKLVDAICEAFTRGLPGHPWEPKDGITHCNEAVQYVAEAMGFFGFTGMLANEMFDLMKHGRNWKEIDARGAQVLANQGNLVIGAWRNPSGHGYVVVVRPGDPQPSANWGGVSPKIMNIGESNFIDKIASFAFTKEQMPTFFVLSE